MRPSHRETGSQAVFQGLSKQAREPEAVRYGTVAEAAQCVCQAGHGGGGCGQAIAQHTSVELGCCLSPMLKADPQCVLYRDQGLRC